jgi:hypothetical protein
MTTMNKIYLLSILILLNLKYISLESTNYTDSNGPIVAAPNAGLVLLYKRQYRPSNHVIYNTAMFPMTAATCYLILVAAARRISACDNFTTHIRHKRILTDIISIAASSATLGMSTVALGTATASIILAKNLEKKVNELQNSMQTMSNRLEVGEARMAQFESNQLKLGMVLKQSEHLLNLTIDQFNQHSTALETQKLV